MSSADLALCDCGRYTDAHPRSIAAWYQSPGGVGLLEPRRLAEKALSAVVQEAYVHGESTRGR
jgi:hypothetical protein